MSVCSGAGMIRVLQEDAFTYVPDERVPLVLADPPYGNIVSDKWDAKTDWHHGLLDWTNHTSTFQETGDVLYVWGGVGKPGDRPFLKYLSLVESETDYVMKNLITWSKKRAYGVKDNYLFTREELVYLIKGTTKPNVFNIPLLDVERGYAGYNAKYPAKSKYLRRTNVWTDITEIFRGKVHVAEKPEALSRIIISTHTSVGDWVLDPFAGSGSAGVAAAALDRNAILLDNDIYSVELMRKKFA